MEVRPRIIGIEVQRVAEGSLGSLPVAQVQKRQTQLVVQLGAPGLQAESLVELRCRTLPIALARKRHSLAVMVFSRGCGVLCEEKLKRKEKEKQRKKRFPEKARCELGAPPSPHFHSSHCHEPVVNRLIWVAHTFKSRIHGKIRNVCATPYL